MNSSFRKVKNPRVAAGLSKLEQVKADMKHRIILQIDLLIDQVIDIVMDVALATVAGKTTPYQEDQNHKDDCKSTESYKFQREKDDEEEESELQLMRRLASTSDQPNHSSSCNHKQRTLKRASTFDSTETLSTNGSRKRICLDLNSLDGDDHHQTQNTEGSLSLSINSQNTIANPAVKDLKTQPQSHQFESNLKNISINHQNITNQQDFRSKKITRKAQSTSTSPTTSNSSLIIYPASAPDELADLSDLPELVDSPPHKLPELSQIIPLRARLSRSPQRLFRFLTNSLKCFECASDQWFSDKTELNLHLQAAHMILPFRCHQKACGGSFQHK